MKARWMVLGLVVTTCVACAPKRLDVRAVSYVIDAEVDPAAHRLEARATVELEALSSGTADVDPAIVELRLHPGLVVEAVEIDGARLRSHKRRRPRRGGDDDGRVRPATHRLALGSMTGRPRITLRYAGELSQDVASGEREGQIHNFAVSAHIGTEGLYLEPSGFWYPRPAEVEDAPPEHGLAGFRLAVDPVEGFELVAGLESDDAGEDGALRWRSPFPLDGLVLLGGPLERFSRVHGDVVLHAVLAPGKADVAEDILDASAEYLDRYEPLIGPYPFSEFTVLEAFFSSGFAFPTCTQIAGSQLSRYKQYRRHGYLDHELLHNWWGNGLLVDPRDGNWCEGLATYMGNYYGFVLDDDPQGARKQRRNQANGLSALKPEDDKPLGTFGESAGAGRGIGYSKGSAVFHMLEQRIGVEAMMAGLRRLTAEQMGRYVSWDTMQAAWEAESGEDLDAFFEQWVRRGGAPQLELTGAEWSPGQEHARVSVAQHGTDFVVDVPLRLFYADAHEDVSIRVNGASTTVELPVRDGLRAIELDPDFHVFRRLETAEVMPTSALTRRATRLLVVVPGGELAVGYQTVLDSYRSAVEGDEDDPHADGEVVVREAGEVTDADLGAGGVLILGEAARDPRIASFLARTSMPAEFGEAGFSVDGRRYGDPLEAVYATVHHPDALGQGVTVYYGNSPDALSNARVLSFYPNSLLVFRSPPPNVEASDASGMPRAEVVERLDLESHDRIDF